MSGVLLFSGFLAIVTYYQNLSEFNLNYSFDLLKEKLLNAKSNGKQKFTITEVGDNKFRIIFSAIEYIPRSGLSFSTKVLFLMSDNGNTVMIGNNQKGMNFIRKNINDKAVFVLKNN